MMREALKGVEGGCLPSGRGGKGDTTTHGYDKVWKFAPAACH